MAVIYLAGGTKCTWQDRLILLLPGHKIIDPRTWGNESDPAIYTRRDLDAIRRADIVIAQMDSTNPSGYGLSIEVGFAYGLNKRIIFIDEIGNDWRSRYFGMHRQMTTVVATAEEAALAL